MNVTIGQKILIGFGVVVALTIGLGWYGLSKLAEVREITSAVVDRDFKAMESLREIGASRDAMKVLRERALNAHLLRRAGLTDQDPTPFQEAWFRDQERTQGMLAELEAFCAERERAGLSPQRGVQWGRLRQTVRETQEALKESAVENRLQFDLMRRGDLSQVIARREALERLRQTFDDRVDSGARLVQELLEGGKLLVASAHEEAKFSTLVALAVVVALGIAASLMIQRSIARPLATFMQFVERVGQGDLTGRAAVSGNGDELGRLGQGLNEMVAGLKEVAGQTRAVTGNLNSAAAEILASTQQQAASAAEQVAAVQQTTTTVEEITQSGAQVSERARQVATASEATVTASQAGMQAVRDINRAMEAIREQAEAVAENIVALSERTQAVGEIVATVRDIAEQSNLLALNAAIEAAAAGEQGRSFSVVAGEMKNLADQARDATVQVRTILEEIQRGINSSVMLTEEAVKRVEGGRQQVGVAEGTIGQMAGSIQEGVQTFQQIVAAVNQQQIGFEQVTQALKNISLATEQTASGTRQLERAAADLNALGQQLQKSVERYRT